MKSKTSFFNGMVFRKNITRFAPVWAVYTLCLLLFVFANTGMSTVLFTLEMVRMMGPMAWINLLYAGACAFYLFGDLFNSRLCNALHAFPLRREGWLLTGIVNGLLFSFVPNLLISLLACVLMKGYGYIAFIWLAISFLQFLFFFGTAVLSAMCAGNRLAMIAVYGILHFFFVLVYVILQQLYQPLLYGIQFNMNDFEYLIPVTQMEWAEYVSYAYQYNNEQFTFEGFVPADWHYLGICAGVGIVGFVLAWLVYRRRHLETAGDFISLRPLAPVFLTIYTLGVGMVLYMFADLFDAKSYAFLAVGLIVGFFTGKMLLERALRVFTKKAFLGFALLIAVLGGSMLVTWLDPIGIVNRVPDLDEIQWVSIYNSYGMAEYSLGDYSQITEPRFAYTDETEITQVQSLHRQLVDAKYNEDSPTSCAVRIMYLLKNGKRVQRFYYVDVETPLGRGVGAYYSDMRYVFQVNDVDTLYQQIRAAEVIDANKYGESSYMIKDEAELVGLLDAIRADCEAGTMAQVWAFQRDATIRYSIVPKFDVIDSDNNAQQYRDLQIRDTCTNTVAYLKSLSAE